MIKNTKLDLHIHTKASNCFRNAEALTNNDVNKLLLIECKNKNLNLIAITDHYTFKNYPGIKELGIKENIFVTPGVELSIKTDLPEKLSLIVLFDENIDTEFVENNMLSELKVPIEARGNGKYLIAKSIPEILNIIKKYDGLVISAHQDKNEDRIKLIPVLIENGIRLLDLRYPDKKEEFLKRFGKNNVFPLTFSDSHDINDVGKYYMTLTLRECSFNGFKEYLEKKINYCLTVGNSHCFTAKH